MAEDIEEFLRKAESTLVKLLPKAWARDHEHFEDYVRQLEESIDLRRKMHKGS